jgi:hypothetical protein
MKKIILVVILLLGPFLGKSLSFEIGETLIYDIKLFGIRAGWQKAEVERITNISNETTYHIVWEVGTSKFFRRFYKLHDRIHTYISTEDYLPRHLEKHIYEGGYTEHTVIDFDQKNQKVIMIKTCPNKNIFGKKILIKSCPKTFDAVSLIYYLRKMDLKAGKDIEVGVISGEKVINVKIKITKGPKLKTKLGEFETIFAERSPGETQIWFSDDDLHLPLKIQTQTPIGTLTAILTEIIRKDDLEVPQEEEQEEKQTDREFGF